MTPFINKLKTEKRKLHFIFLSLFLLKKRSKSGIKKATTALFRSYILYILYLNEENQLIINYISKKAMNIYSVIYDNIPH